MNGGAGATGAGKLAPVPYGPMPVPVGPRQLRFVRSISGPSLLRPQDMGMTDEIANWHLADEGGGRNNLHQGEVRAAVDHRSVVRVFLATAVAGPAAAACVTSGSTVTCSGVTNTGFGTGAEDNLALTVQPDGSIVVGAAQTAINLANGNSAINNGVIVVGDNGSGMQGVDNNAFTNAGTMTIGSGSAAMFLLGNNNNLTNTGTISSTALNSIGFDVLGTGNTLTNSGTITLTGPTSYGISANGSGNTVYNSGVVTVGGSTGTNGDGVFLLNSNNLVNAGTIHAAGANGIAVSAWGDGNAITNSGTIAATGTNGIAIGFGGLNNSVVNNGTIKGSADGFTLFSFGTVGSTLTNNGTLDGQMLLMGMGNSLINAGLITISDPGTPLVAGNLYFGGTFTQTAQGTLALRVDNAGQHDGLSADGQAKLNGTLRAVLQPGLYGSSITYTNVLPEQHSGCGAIFECHVVVGLLQRGRDLQRQFGRPDADALWLRRCARRDREPACGRQRARNRLFDRADR